MLVVDEVTKRFGGVTALSELSLEIPTDRVTGVIGPNGSGKTTLFNVVTGFERPTLGSIIWDGRPITGRRPHRIARMGLVRTFQQTAVFNNLTTYRNVEVAALGAAVKMRDRHRIVSESLARLKLTDYADEPAGEVPFGIARRIGIACTLPLRPKLLLVDEPAAGMTNHEARDLAEALKELGREGMGICVVDHSMEFVSSLCDHVVVMSEGTRLLDGTPTEVLNNDSVREIYLGHSAAAAN